MSIFWQTSVRKIRMSPRFRMGADDGDRTGEISVLARPNTPPEFDGQPDMARFVKQDGVGDLGPPRGMVLPTRNVFTHPGVRIVGMGPEAPEVGGRRAQVVLKLEWLAEASADAAEN